MKKFVIGLLMFMVIAVTVPLSAEAHCGRHRRSARRNSNVSRNYARTNRSYARTRAVTQRRVIRINARRFTVATAI